MKLAARARNDRGFEDVLEGPATVRSPLFLCLSDLLNRPTSSRSLLDDPPEICSPSRRVGGAASIQDLSSAMLSATPALILSLNEFAGATGESMWIAQLVVSCACHSRSRERRRLSMGRIPDKRPTVSSKEVFRTRLSSDVWRWSAGRSMTRKMFVVHVIIFIHNVMLDARLMIIAVAVLQLCISLFEGHVQQRLTMTLPAVPESHLELHDTGWTILGLVKSEAVLEHR